MKSQYFFFYLSCLHSYLEQTLISLRMHCFLEAGIWASWPCRSPTPLPTCLSGAETKFMRRCPDLTSPKGSPQCSCPDGGIPPPLCTPDVFTCPRVTESLIYHWFLTSGVSDPELIRSRGQCCPMSSLPKWKCSVQQPLTTCGF